MPKIIEGEWDHVRPKMGDVLGAPMAQAIGQFGAALVKGAGNLIGDFSQDPLGTTAKTFLGLSMAVALAPWLIPAAVAGVGLMMAGKAIESMNKGATA